MGSVRPASLTPGPLTRTAIGPSPAVREEGHLITEPHALITPAGPEETDSPELRRAPPPRPTVLADTQPPMQSMHHSDTVFSDATLSWRTVEMLSLSLQ
ncbi:unnamed protein product [Arctogadus glacialis]